MIDLKLFKTTTKHFNLEPNPFQEQHAQLMQTALGLIKSVMLVELMYVHVILDSLMMAVELVWQIL